MKSVPIKTANLLFIISLFFSVNTDARFFDSRTDKWEFFLAPQFTNSKVLQFENGSQVDINEHSSLGFGFGYNIDHHIELSVLFSVANSNYTATLIPENDPTNPVKVGASMYTSSVDLGFTYNFLRTAFTPYISADIGTTYIDSGVPTGDITGSCWWDPWYGYICRPVAQTYTATEFKYGAGVGLRYDFNRKVYVKAGVAKNYIDIGSSNTPDFVTYQFIFGAMF